MVPLLCGKFHTLGRQVEMVWILRQRQKQWLLSRFIFLRNRAAAHRSKWVSRALNLILLSEVKKRATDFLELVDEVKRGHRAGGRPGDILCHGFPPQTQGKGYSKGRVFDRLQGRWTGGKGWRVLKKTLALLLMTLTETLSACPLCRAQAAAGIYNPEFGLRCFIVLLPILVLVVIGLGLYYADDPMGKVEKEGTE